MTRRELLTHSAGCYVSAALPTQGAALPAAELHSVGPGDSAAASSLSVQQVGDRVSYHILRQAEFPPGYPADIELEAMLSWGEASRQPGYLEFARQASGVRRFAAGYDMYTYRLQMFSCLPFELYKRFRNPDFVAPFINETRAWRAEALRAYDGLLSYYFPEQAASSTPGLGRSYLDPSFTPILLDNAQEYISRLAKAGAVGGDCRFHQEAADQLMRLRGALRDPENGLWNHGRGWSESARHVASIKWGRAQAWAVRGLVETLTFLPPDSREHRQVAKLLLELAETLLGFQDRQGFWRQVMDLPESWQETSATAFISYYFARAVCQGLLPDDPYRQSSRSAYDALVRDKVSAGGDVFGTCERTPPLDSVKLYLARRTPVNDPHGLATALLCATGQLLLEGAPLPAWMTNGSRWARP